jgi:glycosyltransferase involved in cell wall biosynthesis
LGDDKVASANHRKRVYIHVRTGQVDDAKRIVATHYKDCELTILSHRELREAGWKGQIRALRNLRGEAIVFYCQSVEEIYQPQLLVWTGSVHRCRDTVFADANGHFRVCTRVDWIRLFPKTFLSVLSDAFVLLSSWILLQFLRHSVNPYPAASTESAPDLDVCYLYPYPLDRSAIGGALSHIRGFLGGLAKESVRCEIYSGRELASVPFHVSVIQAQWTHFLLWEPLTLLYNLSFVFRVRKLLGGRRVRMIYQRHGRFVVAGALLSRWLRAPLVLEYNGSEDWTAKFWDPSRFRTWLRLCEEVSLSGASLIVVVSEPLRQDLLRLGIPNERVLLNPNAVNPEIFRPGCGGGALRERLGFSTSDVVVCFIGTFSYWHGIPVLREAIQMLLRKQSGIITTTRLRFLLIGDGPLHTELRADLCTFEGAGDVIFAGAVPHDKVPAYLDASDILVSPHLPMPDGKPFFGSPTKLFEYMAMSKAIIASNLDQLALVLKHEETALLVPPGDSRELEGAIVRLAGNPEMRTSLGRRAREAAVAEHTWQQNACRVLQTLAPRKSTANGSISVAESSISAVLVTANKPADD